MRTANPQCALCALPVEERICCTQTGRGPAGIREEEKILIGEEENMCNPIAQAEILNDAGTELNILLGLCVGHDALFIRYARAYTTVFAVKDRVLGHNPLALIYTRNSYSARFLEKRCSG